VIFGLYPLYLKAELREKVCQEKLTKNSPFGQETLIKTLLSRKQPIKVGMSMGKNAALVLVLVFIASSCTSGAAPVGGSADAVAIVMLAGLLVYSMKKRARSISL